MAKYCVKCGKPLPKGVKVCPDCADESRESGAALFTQMTAETVDWKPATPVKQKHRSAWMRSNRKTLVLCCAVALVLAVAGTLLLVFRPSARVSRAIRSGDIQQAYELYWSSASLSGERARSIDKAAISAAEKLCTQFAANEIDADTAASRLSMLGGFGDGMAELLEEYYEQFRQLNWSHEHFDTGRQLFDQGRFLEAREEFLLVKEGDAEFPAAQTRIEDCLTGYGQEVVDQAQALIEKNDFRGARDLLKQGNDVLAGFGTFSQLIDSKRQACYGQYEDYVLAQANAKAAEEDYDAAVEIVRAALPDFTGTAEFWEGVLEQFTLQARDQHVAQAGDQADALYAEGDYAGAFAVLTEIRSQAEENEAGSDELIAALERRFAEDICHQAAECYDKQRDNLPDAIAILDEALEIRSLEDIRTYRDDLAQYLPLSLVTAGYAAKDGLILRSDGSFESLDGAKYTGGWIWGENESSISFDLNGAYDVFTCAFATRRDDSANANGRFELWCDGEKVYTADKLYHWQKESRSITVDISGCQELKIVFLCDYTVSTAENGYCYHGLCAPSLTKALP